MIATEDSLRSHAHRNPSTGLACLLPRSAMIAKMLDTAICIPCPCMMPYITSQFLPRSSGDRSERIPEGAKKLAFIGQYCEMPDDVVFTVEYSVRSAQTAIHSLLGLEKAPPYIRGATIRAFCCRRSRHCTKFAYKLREIICRVVKRGYSLLRAHHQISASYQKKILYVL